MCYVEEMFLRLWEDHVAEARAGKGDAIWGKMRYVYGNPGENGALTSYKLRDCTRAFKLYSIFTPAKPLRGLR